MCFERDVLVSELVCSKIFGAMVSATVTATTCRHADMNESSDEQSEAAREGPRLQVTTYYTKEALGDVERAGVRIQEGLCVRRDTQSGRDTLSVHRDTRSTETHRAASRTTGCTV